jgi:acetylornithine deacetylase/succinyl-diaminopimelate desuccinylase-like protein
MQSAIALTQELVRFNTVNPPGGERACAERLAGLLEGAGFTVELIPFGEGRAQLDVDQIDKGLTNTIGGDILRCLREIRMNHFCLPHDVQYQH